MDTSPQYHEIAAALIPRIFLGLLFLFQGADKVFSFKIKNVIEVYKQPLSEKGIPEFFISSGIWFTSLAELICGTLLIFGLAKYLSLYVLGLDLIFASMAFGVIRPMWDMQHVFPRLVLLIFLLVIPSAWDVLSIDNLLQLNLK